MTLQALAKEMRSSATDAETAVWRMLRSHRLAETKWKRQQPLGRYIVDFVCFEARLIVEVDGGQHNQCEHDVERDAWLSANGYVVLRFWNNEVLGKLEGVLTRVLEQLEARKGLGASRGGGRRRQAESPLSPTPPPRGGREVSTESEPHKSIADDTRPSEKAQTP